MDYGPYSTFSSYVLWEKLGSFAIQSRMLYLFLCEDKVTKILILLLADHWS